MYGIVAIGIAFALVVAFFSHYENIVGENKAAAQTIQTCQADKTGLETALGAANDGADAVKKAADERVRVAEQKAADAKKEGEKHVREAIDIMNRQLPPGVNACDAARDLIVDYAKSRRK